MKGLPKPARFSRGRDGIRAHDSQDPHMTTAKRDIRKPKVEREAGETHLHVTELLNILNL